MYGVGECVVSVLSKAVDSAGGCCVEVCVGVCDVLV